MQDRILTQKYLMFLSAMVAFTLVMCGIIISAYVDPDHTVTVATNMFGEALIECVLAIIMIPATIWFFYTELRDRSLIQKDD